MQRKAGMNKSRSQNQEVKIQNDKAEATLTDFLFFWLLTYVL